MHLPIRSWVNMATGPAQIRMMLDAAEDMRDKTIVVIMRVPRINGDLITAVETRNSGSGESRVTETTHTLPGTDLFIYEQIQFQDVLEDPSTSQSAGFDGEHVDQIGVTLRLPITNVPTLKQFWIYIDKILIWYTHPDPMFTGYIGSIQPKVDFAADGTLLVAVRCRDIKMLLDSAVISKAYPTQADRAVILDILAETDLNLKIFADAESIANIANVGLTFENASVTEALNTICEATGGGWRLGSDKILYYFNPSVTTYAPFELSDNRAQINNDTVLPYHIESDYALDFYTPANWVKVTGRDATDQTTIISAIAEDLASQAQYGIFRYVYNTGKYASLASLQQIADNYIAQNKKPKERMTVQLDLVNSKKLRVGQVIKIYNSKLPGFNPKEMLVQRISGDASPEFPKFIRWNIDLGDYRPDLLKELRNGLQTAL